MKRAVLLLLAVALLLGGTAAPSAARVDNDAVQIMINGVRYDGEWAYIGGRPYVGVESFGKSLGFPREHNVKGWCLNPPPPPASQCNVSPFELAVQAKGKALPTVRFAGVTMVDLRTALEALDIPFHYRFYDRTYSVGNPYYGEYMKGAYYRWLSLNNDWNDMGWGDLPLRWGDVFLPRR